MITRRHLRTKVMQALYAQQFDPSENLKAGESWILKSSKDFYLLYITLLDLFRELHDCGYALYEKNIETYKVLWSTVRTELLFLGSRLLKTVLFHSHPVAAGIVITGLCVLAICGYAKFINHVLERPEI